jgi:parallel beta-helix repeat protein
MIKTYLFALILSLSFQAKAQRVFYISSSSGNDQSSGLNEKEAWKSFEKLNSFVAQKGLKPGDQIYLKRGDIWFEQMTLNGHISRSTKQKPNILGSYGSGEKPIIDGTLKPEQLKTHQNYPYRGNGISILNFNDLSIQDIHVRNVLFGINIESSHNIAIKNNLVENTISIAIYSRDKNGNILIEQNEIRNSGNDAIYIRKSKDCVVRGNAIDGVVNEVNGHKTNGDQSAIGLEKSKRTLVENNKVTRAIKAALDYYFDEDSESKNNYFESETHFASPHGSGIKLHHNTWIGNPDKASSGINVINTGKKPITVNDNIIFGFSLYGLSAKVPGKGAITFKNNSLYSVGPRAKPIDLMKDVTSEKNCIKSGPAVHISAAAPGEYTKYFLQCP